MASNDKIYSIVLPGGTKHERRSPRPYAFAIATIVTKAYRDQVLDKIDEEIFRLRDRCAALHAKAQTAEDRAAFEAATARVVYLEQEVTEIRTGYSGAQKNEYRCARWLSDEFKTQTVGFPKPVEYGPRARAWHDAGLRAIQDAKKALEATAQGEIDANEKEIEARQRARAYQADRLVVCEALEVNWSQSAGSAAKQVAKMRKTFPLCEVLVYQGDEIKVHEPKRRAPKAKTEPAETAVAASERTEPEATEPAPVESKLDPESVKEIAEKQRQTVAKSRARAAMHHMQKAREELDAACRALCSVVGANEIYGAIAKLSRETKDFLYEIDGAIERPIEPGMKPWELDHDAAEPEKVCAIVLQGNSHVGCCRKVS